MQCSSEAGFKLHRWFCMSGHDNWRAGNLARNITYGSLDKLLLDIDEPRVTVNQHKFLLFHLIHLPVRLHRGRQQRSHISSLSWNAVSWYQYVDCLATTQLKCPRLQNFTSSFSHKPQCSFVHIKSKWKINQVYPATSYTLLRPLNGLCTLISRPPAHGEQCFFLQCGGRLVLMQIRPEFCVYVTAKT